MGAGGRPHSNDSRRWRDRATPERREARAGPRRRGNRTGPRRRENRTRPGRRRQRARPRPRRCRVRPRPRENRADVGRCGGSRGDGFSSRGRCCRRQDGHRLCRRRRVGGTGWPIMRSRRRGPRRPRPVTGRRRSRPAARLSRVWRRDSLGRVKHGAGRRLQVHVVGPRRDDVGPLQRIPHLGQVGQPSGRRGGADRLAVGAEGRAGGSRQAVAGGRGGRRQGGAGRQRWGRGRPVANRTSQHRPQPLGRGVVGGLPLSHAPHVRDGGAPAPRPLWTAVHCG